MSRPLSPSLATSPVHKKVKTTHSSEGNFASGLFEPAYVEKLRSSYADSEPYKHAVVDALFRDDLLRDVKDEIIRELSFTEKETDIYRVHQTGDLASLSYLEADQIALLPSLLTLRDSLYSPTFRHFIQRVTGCAALSGTKQDMSVNSYKEGCHLLNHDDVIGTRMVSYILYMPLPLDEPWKPEWGGALELYPTVVNGLGIPEPEAIPSKTIAPSWNQFIFFKVQPGRSFHSVEEVVVGNDVDGKQRLSISGWFHKAQQGEDGFTLEKDADELQQSSLEQLAASSVPTSFTPYVDPLTLELINNISELTPFLNPTYLQIPTINALANRFAQDSSLELHSFLKDTLAAQLLSGLRSADARDGLGPPSTRPTVIPPHLSGVGPNSGWEISGPPHKHRFCTLSSNPLPTLDPVVETLHTLQEKLFKSVAFRSWLALLTSCNPSGHVVHARRFRPGLDYTLARSDEKDVRVDAVLGLTPTGDSWASGTKGGWECYMAPHEGDDDPAVYRSGSKGTKKTASEPKVNEAVAVDGEAADEEEDDDDDGALLTVQPGFNKLLLVLRDEGIMHFVKYVSSHAEGSRWDISGEYSIAADADADIE